MKNFTRWLFHCADNCFTYMNNEVCTSISLCCPDCWSTGYIIVEKRTYLTSRTISSISHCIFMTSMFLWSYSFNCWLNAITLVSDEHRNILTSLSQYPISKLVEDLLLRVDSLNVQIGNRWGWWQISDCHCWAATMCSPHGWLDSSFATPNKV